MLTSTEIVSCGRIIGEERAIELFAKAGFDAWDFSMFDMFKYDFKNNCVLSGNDHPLAGAEAYSFAKKLRKVGEDNGIHCNQSHAPFQTGCKEIRDFYKKAIELTAIAGGKICVIHPDNYLSAMENAEIYSELLPFAKEHGVKIAAENMWNWDKEKDCASPAACSDENDFKAHLDAVDDDFLVACVDIGHAEMKGLNTSAAKMIYALKDKVQTLHIHDNDKLHDSHQIPFSMEIDFDPIVKALKDINYNGYLTLEADRYLISKGYDKDPTDIFTGIKEMFNSVDALRKMFETV